MADAVAQLKSKTHGKDNALNILAFDSTAKTASVALVRDGVCVADFFVNNGKTHSEILLPMAEDVLSRAHIPLSEIDLFAVTAGPGSFTGVRIGAATVKGLAFSLEEKENCVAVSTLEAIAERLFPLDGIYVPVMDARRGEVYSAIFRAKDGTLERLAPDRAISLSALGEELLTLYSGETVRLAGDGYDVAKAALAPLDLRLAQTPIGLRTQNAASAALCAERAYARGEAVTPTKIAPIYLRLPQAERDRLNKQN